VKTNNSDWGGGVEQRIGVIHCMWESKIGHKCEYVIGQEII
jgi:hypothetical protein